MGKAHRHRFSHIEYSRATRAAFMGKKWKLETTNCDLQTVRRSAGGRAFRLQAKRVPGHALPHGLLGSLCLRCLGTVKWNVRSPPTVLLSTALLWGEFCSEGRRAGQ